MKKIEIITHYEKSDKECNSDYVDIEVKVDGKVVRTYEDSYHDKGKEKSEAFIDGLLWPDKTKEMNIALIKKNVADRDI